MQHRYRCQLCKWDGPENESVADTAAYMKKRMEDIPALI